MRIKQFFRQLFFHKNKNEEIIEELILTRKKKNQKREKEVFAQPKQPEIKKKTSKKEKPILQPTKQLNQNNLKKQGSENSKKVPIHNKSFQTKTYKKPQNKIKKETSYDTKETSKKPEIPQLTTAKLLSKKEIPPQKETNVFIQQSIQQEMQITFHSIKKDKEEHNPLEVSFLKHLSNVIVKDYLILQEIEKEMDHIKLQIDQTKEISNEDQKQKKLQEIQEKLEKLKKRYEELEKDRTNEDLEILNLDELHYFKNKIEQIKILEQADIPQEETTHTMLLFIQELEEVHQELMKKNQEKKLELAEREKRFEELTEEKKELEFLWQQGNQLLEKQQETLNHLEKKVGNFQEKTHLNFNIIPHGIHFLTNTFFLYQLLNQTKQTKNSTAGILMGAFFFTKMGQNLYQLFEVKTTETYEVIFNDYASVLENQKDAITQITTYLIDNQQKMKSLKQKILLAYKQEKSKNSQYEQFLKQIDHFEEILHIQKEKLRNQEQQILEQQKKNKQGKKEAQQRKKILQKKQETQ